MNKNTIIGIVLMVALFVGYGIYQASELEKQQEIALVQQQKKEEALKAQQERAKEERAKEAAMTPEQKAQRDSINLANAVLAKVNQHGETLLAALNGESTPLTLENDYMSVTFDNRGGKIVDGRVKQLKDLDDGHVWRYMYRNFFAEMRMAGGGIVCEVECKKPSKSYQEQIVISSKRSLVVVNGDTTSYSNNDVFSVVPKDTIHLNYKDTIRITNDSEKFQQVIEEAIEETPRKVKKGKAKTVKTNVAKNGHRGFSMGIKTNTLYDLALIPNIGADFHLGKGWTIGFNWMYAWWNIEDYRLYHRIYGGDINVRKYFSSRHDSPLSGHHVGLYSEILTYDIAYGGKGQKADRWSYGAGVEYGYSFPIARRLNLDLTIGAGYLTGKYENYSATEEANHYVWESSYMRRWFGPTKAEVSLVWLIGRNNYTQK